ncbi:alpha beta-propellor repeat-containing integrin [Carpediemonas membranifera]|uniref:Alpha beta-propellor repeat-containing integrin n=1 Tax=Carpediemonas membranifera TaxID=201153 RepID=A0A8J6AQF2_9EUKA|nr:alpha beta-propellor repeat-containing integrin [Carpediemonas membranifera]|eukprot:KAG9390958.1 alpha beta-propellor repeat-containing integrin [Carpediemonas membranifera]
MLGPLLAVIGVVLASLSLTNITDIEQVASDGQFGFSMAISEPNKQYVFISAPYSAVDTKLNAGLVFVLSTSFEPLLKISAATPMASTLFGAALAATDKYLLVGAPGANAGSGVVYAFTLSADITPVRTLQPPTAQVGRFGSHVALSNGLVAVSEPEAGYGLVHVFSITSKGAFKYLATLQPPVTVGKFGSAVGVCGGKVVVGAPGSQTKPGAVLSFGMDESNAWHIEQTLAGSVGDGLGLAMSCDFVSTVPTLAVASNSATAVYSLAGSTWGVQASVAKAATAIDIRDAKLIAGHEGSGSVGLYAVGPTALTPVASLSQDGAGHAVAVGTSFVSVTSAVSADKSSVFKATSTCPTGTQWTTTGCTPCPPGKFSGAGAVGCSYASPGYVADPDKTRQDPCDGGTYYDSFGGYETCTTCPGLYSTPTDGKPHAKCLAWMPTVPVIDNKTLLVVDEGVMAKPITHALFVGNKASSEALFPCHLVRFGGQYTGRTAIVPVVDGGPTAVFAGQHQIKVYVEGSSKTVAVNVGHNDWDTRPVTINGTTAILIAEDTVCATKAAVLHATVPLTAVVVTTPDDVAQCQYAREIGVAEIKAIGPHIQTTLTSILLPQTCLGVVGAEFGDTEKVNITVDGAQYLPYMYRGMVCVLAHGDTVAYWDGTVVATFHPDDTTAKSISWSLVVGIVAGVVGCIACCCCVGCCVPNCVCWCLCLAGGIRVAVKVFFFKPHDIDRVPLCETEDYNWGKLQHMQTGRYHDSDSD